LVAIALGTVACVAHAGPKPVQRAKQLVDAQVAALEGDEAKLTATFASDAILLVPDR
jgi:uncharacterized protein with beta-barrel porin domain